MAYDYVFLAFSFPGGRQKMLTSRRLLFPRQRHTQDLFLLGGQHDSWFLGHGSLRPHGAEVSIFQSQTAHPQDEHHGKRGGCCLHSAPHRPREAGAQTGAHLIKSTLARRPPGGLALRTHAPSPPECGLPVYGRKWMPLINHLDRCSQHPSLDFLLDYSHTQSGFKKKKNQNQTRAAWSERTPPAQQHRPEHPPGMNMGPFLRISQQQSADAMTASNTDWGTWPQHSVVHIVLLRFLCMLSFLSTFFFF